MIFKILVFRILVWWWDRRVAARACGPTWVSRLGGSWSSGRLDGGGSVDLGLGWLRVCGDGIVQAFGGGLLESLPERLHDGGPATSRPLVGLGVSECGVGVGEELLELGGEPGAGDRGIRQGAGEVVAVQVAILIHA